jgi:hypothetical protein
MEMLKKKITQPYIIAAYYLADRQDGHVVDDVIAGWTGIFPCNWGTIAASHEERGYFLDGTLWFYSASIRKEMRNRLQGGTGWITAEEMLKNPERWALRISLHQTEREIKTELVRASRVYGFLYDTIGVILDFLRPGLFFKKGLAYLREKIYCSKTCHYLQTGQMKRISPRRRSRYIMRHGYAVISVKEALAMQN